MDNYVRQATWVRTIDGDTFVADIQLMHRLVHPQPILRSSIRVRGWNAAELRDDEGPYMREVFDRQLRETTLLTVVAAYGMSFSRIVADVYLDDKLFLGILQTSLATLRKRKDEHADD